jgi:hypothetical protein
MGSFQERIVAYANLLALSKELDQLRERVKRAEKLCAAPKPTEAGGRQLSPTSTALAGARAEEQRQAQNAEEERCQNQKVHGVLKLIPHCTTRRNSRQR